MSLLHCMSKNWRKISIMKGNNSTKYGWIYNHKGELVKVYPPINSEGKTITHTSGTQTGKLGANVGFPNMRK